MDYTLKGCILQSLKEKEIIKKRDLVKMFARASDEKAEYIGVTVSIADMPEYEIIINKYANIDHKLEYYMNAYDENLVLKNCDKIKIIKIGYGNTLSEIEDILCI